MTPVKSETRPLIETRIPIEQNTQDERISELRNRFISSAARSVLVVVVTGVSIGVSTTLDQHKWTYGIPIVVAIWGSLLAILNVCIPKKIQKSGIWQSWRPEFS